MISLTNSLLASILLALWASQTFADSPIPLRTPQFPLKNERRIYTEDRLRIARENIDRYPRAKAVADAEIAAASEWLVWSDEELMAMIHPPSVPRAFNVGTEGCPTCGKKIYEVGGTYPWKLDLKRFLEVECPICGERFPNEQHPDPGRGWVGPNGHHYWFIAYANHWNLYDHVIPGIRSLSRAYLLTGDPRFAHKAVVLLHRIAEVYPGMDHPTQSRYGAMMAEQGARYEGKIVNHIWETNVLHMLSESYDSVWDSIDEDGDLQNRIGKKGEEIRAFIEANLLEDGIDAVFARKIIGNYGMHQKALIFAALARDEGPIKDWLDFIVKGRDANILLLGLDYALYNLVYHDGVPYETAPGYNFSWVRNITEIAETLRWAGMDMYIHPKMKTLYDGVLDVVQIGRHTPSLGDSGNVWGGLVGRDAYTFQAAYRAYGDERYRKFLQSFGAVGDSGFNTFETLFHPPVEPGEEVLPPQPSRLLDGYGMAVLNNASDTNSISLYYGYAGGHGHFDRLHFDVFANGWPMTPDLGYPDFMNAFVPGIYTWSKNTIAHNTVTVDARRQASNEKGRVRAFTGSGRVRMMEVEASGTYPQCEAYRRLVVMVDVDAERSYFVDLFTAVGGGRHDYSLHGPPGEFIAIGGEWTDPATGTLAGATVEVGELYDDPVLGAKDFKGSYVGYSGSGFQHFINPQRRISGDWVGEYRHAKDPDVRLRIRILPNQDQEIILADAQISPVKQKDLVKFILASREGSELRSNFLAVLEPYRSEPFLESVTLRADAEDSDGIELIVSRSDGVVDRIQIDCAGPGAERVLVLDSNGGEVVLSPPLMDEVVHENPIKVGRPHIVSASGTRIETSAQFEFGPTYRGSFLTDLEMQRRFAIRDAGRTFIELVEPLPADHPFRAGEDAWVVEERKGE